MNPLENHSSEDYSGYRFLLIDDDAIITVLFKRHLENYFPNAEINYTNQPKIEPGYDVYFIDNDFDGKRLARALANEIRRFEPQAFIVALSLTIDFYQLKGLVNSGCNAVYSKNAPESSDEARLAIREHLAAVRETTALAQTSGSLNTTIKSLSSLLRRWNSRLRNNLEILEARTSKTDISNSLER